MKQTVRKLYYICELQELIKLKYLSLTKVAYIFNVNFTKTYF